MSGFQVLQMLMLGMNNDWPFRATTPLRKPTHIQGVSAPFENHACIVPETWGTGLARTALRSLLPCGRALLPAETPCTRPAGRLERQEYK